MVIGGAANARRVVLKPPAGVSRRADTASAARVRDKIRCRRKSSAHATPTADASSKSNPPTNRESPSAGDAAAGAERGTTAVAWGGGVGAMAAGAGGICDKVAARVGGSGAGAALGVGLEGGSATMVFGCGLDSMTAATGEGSIEGGSGGTAGAATTAGTVWAGTSTGAAWLSAGAVAAAGAGFGGGLLTALISPLTRLPTSTATPVLELDPEFEPAGWSFGGVPAGACDWPNAAEAASEAIANQSSGRISVSPLPLRSRAFLSRLSSVPRPRRGGFKQSGPGLMARP